MRFVVVTLALACLTACGQPATTPSATTTPVASDMPAWQAALTDNPTVIRGISTAVGALPGATVTPGSNGATRISTPAANGAWAGMIRLTDAHAPGQLALRINAQASRGALHFIASYENAPADYDAQKVTIEAGDSRTVLLPIDQAGSPLLIVANGNGEGASVGTINSIELVGSPTP